MWRVPGEETVHFGMQTYGNPELIYDMAELDGRTGFVIAPFQVSDKHPFVLIKPDCLDLPEDVLENPQDMIEVVAHDNPPLSDDEEEKRHYCSAFHLFRDPLLRGVQDKLV